jgi:flagellar basal-body rod protein FlgB
MLSRLDNDLAFIQNALALRSQRQEILASNLANADTPNYKARDIDFASALRQAMGGTGGSLAMAQTSPRHLAGDDAAGSSPSAPVLYRVPLQPSIDGNTVDVNVERADFADNAMHYQFLLERANSVFRTINLALSPQGS